MITAHTAHGVTADWPRFTLEPEAAILRIPAQLIDDAGRGMRCAGTRCDALQGSVGDQVSCAIYADRPQVCRDCAPGDDACTIARAGAGLAPIETVLAERT